MGVNASKSKMMNRRNLCDERVGGVIEKAVFLQKEVKEMVYEREKESKGNYHERDMMVFAFKEAEWKQERKRLKEEVKRLRKMVEEKEDKIRGMGQAQVSEKGQELLSTSFLVEQMRQERARRDEAVEKWKHLYLAIKTELDHLIQRTDRGDAQYWRSEEEDMIEELQKEVVAKEETIKALKAQLASIEHEDYKKEREIDILRQSLRIMSSKKMASRAIKNLP
ncbi:cilia- and flagella-associated protein 58-like [Corylus avellana]|uniref:cilia- and flagella-associated protein 58-like n=1 Tax=Corylus avellana TaxID=13451 RepID=UPI001E234884|nr:cilia- and flagella-associated protein 58-like [Corylus avellana]